MTREEAVKILNLYGTLLPLEADEAVDMAIEALNCSEKPTGSDLISRQDAIDKLAKFVPYAIYDKSTESYVNGLTDAYNLICQLPTVEPRLTEDGTLEVNALDARAVKRALVGDSKNWGGLYYPDEEPRTGKWMLKGHLWECDQCGCRINRAKPLKGNIWNYNFCPNCGAKMEGDSDG